MQDSRDVIRVGTCSIKGPDLMTLLSASSKEYEQGKHCSSEELKERLQERTMSSPKAFEAPYGKDQEPPVSQHSLSDLIAAKAFIQELKGKTTRQLKEIVLKTPNTPELEEGERLLLVMSIKILQGRMPKASYNTFLLEVVEAARKPYRTPTGRIEAPFNPPMLQIP